jgi:dienelactone hydrolase
MGRFLSSLFAAAVAVLSFGQTASPQKRNLLPADYAAWQYLAGARISNDGHWLVSGVSTVEGDSLMTLRNCDSKEKWEVAGGTHPRFTEDSKWCVYLVEPPKAVAARLVEEHKPVEPILQVRNLSTGIVRQVDRVGAFELLKLGPTVLISRLRGANKAEGGSDLEILNLGTGDTLTVGNVVAATPNQSGDLVLLGIDSDSGDKGVQVLDLKNSSLKTLAWGADDVEGVTWGQNIDVAAFLLGKKDEKKNGAAYRVEIASNLRDVKPAVFELDPSTRADFPKGKRISPYMGVTINNDGTAVGFGVQDWTDVRKDERKPEDRSNVQVWNTHDVRVIPTQIVRARSDLQRSDLWAWRSKDNRMVPVTQGDAQVGELLGDFEHALLLDDQANRSAVTTGFNYSEFSIFDPWTAKKNVLESKSHWTNSIAPSRKGGYIAYYFAKNWWLVDVATGKKRNMTGKLSHSFEESEDDHAAPEKNFAYGPVWLKDDKGVVLGDDFDQFLVKPSVDEITPLTEGRAANQVFRLADVVGDPEGIDIQQPFFFHVLDKDTKASGYAMTDATGKGKVLAMDNVEMGALHKAKDVDRFVFIMASFTKSPDAYVTNGAFSAIKPETHTNPQQALFNWGHTELVSYKSRWGAPLHATLVYPADYVKGKKYPMVTYIYERLSDNLNEYVVPDPQNPYNVQILSQNGYFVLMPDITYQRRRRPGEDAVDCLEPALNAVFAKNVGVDSAHVGLMGHSWGAYQTAFVTTVSKAFAAGVAGAPITELTSMYNSFYWVNGLPDQELFESLQGRMEVPFWDDPKPYIDNSPVWRSKERKAPLLFAAGNADGMVDWHQSLYLYNTLRRLGKDAVLLVYPGEDHSLSRKAVSKDYGTRLRHFLDVYLKGAAPEPWITKGVPFIHPDDAP